MTTQQELDEAYAEGSTDTCNTILQWLYQNGGDGWAARIRLAWEDGTMFAAAEPSPPPQPVRPALEQTLLAEPPLPKLDRQLATHFGFTGDECSHCNNFTMVRNGTCLKCTTCGTTTGCS